MKIILIRHGGPNYEKSENRIKNIQMQNQAEIERINQESRNRILINEQRINEILMHYQQDVQNYF